MHASMAKQHEWFAAVLRGHYGAYGRPHNYPALNRFYREVRRTWMPCLRRRSQKSRRMGWSEFETLTARFRLPVPRITRTGADMTRVTLGKSRVRESRLPGSVGAKPNARATRPRPVLTERVSVNLAVRLSGSSILSIGLQILQTE
jgi:hypothetical protein